MTDWLPKPLSTERVLVRPPMPGDESALVTLLADSDVRRFVGGALDPETAVSRVTAQVAEPAWGAFVIVYRPSGMVIGSGDIARKRGPWEVSYQLSRGCWGQGLAREALDLVTSWYFANMGEPRLIAVTQEANVRSCQLLERAGAVLTATFEQYGLPQRQYEFLR